MQKKSDSNSLPIIILVIIIAIGTGLFVWNLVNGTRKEAEVIIENDTIEITGQYGVTYSLTDIEGLQIKEDIPEIKRKVNGAGLGSIKKGDYELEGLGTCRLFLHGETGPYLYLKVNGKYTIMCFEAAEKTEQIYNKLVDEAPNLRN